MKCDRCPYPTSIDDECGWFENFGTIWKDGSYGCTVHPNTLKKNQLKHEQAITDYCIYFAITNDFAYNNWNLEQFIEDCKHMIGYSPKSVYHRHGKSFYKAYRNYWYGHPRDDMEHLCCDSIGAMRKWQADNSEYVFYSLTKDGLRWLSGELKVIIKEDK